MYIYTSVARVRHEYYPTEKNAPEDRRESRIVGSVTGVVHVLNVAHLRRLYERFVKKSDGNDPSQRQMALCAEQIKRNNEK